MFGDHTEEAMLKNAAAQQCKDNPPFPASQFSTQGMAGDGGALGVRESLLARIRYKAGRAANEARKAEKLTRLQYLLAMHPEVADILDLIEEVG